MKKKLSICIATRNREKFIGQTIASIAEQCNSTVEIVILDGASTDDTEKIVKEIQQRVPFLHYYRQDKNGGVDRDYDNAVGLATGDYCWLMSDDDLLMPGAVNQVLHAIDSSYSLIVVNSEVRNIDFSELIDGNRLKIFQDQVYHPRDFKDFFVKISGYLTYIGAVVIDRNLWKSRSRDKYYGSYFIHVGVIFQEPLPADIIVLSNPLISVRFGNTQWRPKEFEIRMIRWTDLVSTLSAIPLEVRKKKYSEEPWLSAKSLMFYRAKGTYDLHNYRKWIKPRVKTIWGRAQAWLIAWFPGYLANLIGLIYCSFDYPDSRIHFLDMKASRFYFRNWCSKNNYRL